MDNQHQKITGYRDLTQQEIDLMNAIKAKGEELGALMDKLSTHVEMQRSAAIAAGSGKLGDINGELQRIDRAQPGRWLSIARTDLQTGIMAAVRAIAQPGSF